MLSNNRFSKFCLTIVSALIVSFSLLSCNTQKSSIDKTVVKELDIQKYLGKWYEIARYDHSFEEDLVGVNVNYSMRKDGKIKVVNSGYKKTLNGEFSQAIGKAKIPNPDVPSKLRVSFFWIFYADYFVLDLDKNYQWSVVGSSSDKYLWILSRTPQMKKEVYDDLIKKLKERGYDTSKLIKVKQPNS
ncbi:MAG: lipocalin [Flavobacteriales bacterium]|nr:MAG: lipocalin [Flavobacteriales bacterium]